MNAVSVTADSLDGLRLNFALQAGILRLLSRQEHLNKINVFPVPDGDTGTNLALTVNAVLGSLRKWPDRHAGKTLTRVADAALDGARGNSGAILAQFLLGLCDRVGHLNQIGSAQPVDVDDDDRPHQIVADLGSYPRGGEDLDFRRIRLAGGRIDITRKPHRPSTRLGVDGHADLPPAHGPVLALEIPERPRPRVGAVVA